MLKQSVNTDGYLIVNLFCGNRTKDTYLVSRLVAMAWWDFLIKKTNEPIQKSDDWCVNHINGNILNNSIDNLEICTRQYNMQFDSKPVIQFTNSGKILTLYRNAAIAATSTKLNKSSIYKACNSLKPYGGYMWEFCDIFMLNKILTLMGKIDINTEKERIEWIEI